MIDQEVFRPIFYGLVMWAAAIYAFRRGGREERLTAICMIVGSYLSSLVASPRETYFRNVEESIALVDSCLFLSLLLIALRSNRFWPLWLAALQGVTVLGHFAPLIPNMPASMSYHAVALWAYPQWVIIAYATRLHQQKQSRGDPFRIL